MNKIKYLGINVLLLSALCFISSCATQSAYKKVYTTFSEEQPVYIDSDLVILVLPPKIKYESIYNESELNSRGNTEQFENSVLTILKNKGFNLKTINQIQIESSSFQDDLKKIQDNSELMYKAFVDSALKESVKQFGEKSDTKSILLINCDVKIGSQGTWNSYSGAITSQNNRTILKAILIRTSDCTKLWYNNIQLRKVTEVEDPAFEKAINSIFINLKPKRNV
jgi:hypothetical protein